MLLGVGQGERDQAVVDPQRIGHDQEAGARPPDHVPVAAVERGEFRNCFWSDLHQTPDVNPIADDQRLHGGERPIVGVGMLAADAALPGPLAVAEIESGHLEAIADIGHIAVDRKCQLPRGPIDSTADRQRRDVAGHEPPSIALAGEKLSLLLAGGLVGPKSPGSSPSSPSSRPMSCKAKRLGGGERRVRRAWHRRRRTTHSCARCASRRPGSRTRQPKAARRPSEPARCRAGPRRRPSSPPPADRGARSRPESAGPRSCGRGRTGLCAGEFAAGNGSIAEPQIGLGRGIGAAITDRHRRDRRAIPLVDRLANLQHADRAELADHRLPQLPIVGQSQVDRSIDRHQ